MKVFYSMTQLMTSSKKIFFPFIFAFLLSISPAPGSSLQNDTRETFAKYADDAEKELVERRNGVLSFFREAGLPANQAALSRGDKVITNLNDKDETPGGIIHDWIGAVFIPGVRLENVVDTLLDYDSHDEIFSEVIDSRLENRSGNLLTVYMRFKKKEIITVVTDTRHEATLYPISGNKAQIFSRSTKINEVENFGKTNETVLPEGEDHGFLWRMHSYWSLEEGKNGVLVECRSITLSRDIPLGLAFIIGPIINRMPRESLESVLETLKAHLAHLTRSSSKAGS